MFLIKKSVLLTLAVFCLALGSVSAQTEVIYNQIDELDGLLKGEGYSRSFDLEVASLNEDDSDRYTLDLDAGTTYKIIAVCDGDCEDIDLFLYNPGYTQIDSDEEEDDVPIVEVTPKSSGEYQVKITMFDCGVEPCYFGIAVYER